MIKNNEICYETIPYAIINYLNRDIAKCTKKRFNKIRKESSSCLIPKIKSRDLKCLKTESFLYNAFGSQAIQLYLKGVIMA